MKRFTIERILLNKYNDLLVVLFVVLFISPLLPENYRPLGFPLVAFFMLSADFIFAPRQA